MNRIVELEQKSSELLSDIEDVLHATSINMRGTCTQVSQPLFATLQQQFDYTQSLLQSLKQLVKSRQQLFMTFLITKQIQDQEIKVRRERLSQYEQKIFDQKRIIGDKESVFECLLRPKRKRPPHQTTEQYHQTRIKEKQAQQKMKADVLVKEMIDFQSFRRLMDQQQHLKRKAQLQSTKQSAESQINLQFSNIEPAEFATQRFVPREQKGVKQNRLMHSRTHSAQHTFSKQFISPKKQESHCDLDTAKLLLLQIGKMSEQNEEIHKIYDQQINSYYFKKSQKAKALKQYQLITNQLKNVRNQFVNMKRDKNWMHERVCERPQIKKRSDSK